MFYNATNGSVQLDGAETAYAAFGTGSKALVMIPGVGEGLKSVKGTAALMAMTFAAYARDYRVYVFGRKAPLPEGSTTRDMAGDLSRAMSALNISAAHVVGVSMGGMIAQYLAIDHPEQIDRLVLAVTYARPNETSQATLSRWLDMAQRGDYKALMADTAECSYTEKRLKGYRLVYPLLGLMGKHADMRRFIIQLNACIDHCAMDELRQLHCPTLVIGGGNDRALGGQSSGELAQAIPGSQLKLYPGLSHGAYEEAKDFNPQVIRFLQG